MFRSVFSYGLLCYFLDRLCWVCYLPRLPDRMADWDYTCVHYRMNWFLHLTTCAPISLGCFLAVTEYLGTHVLDVCSFVRMQILLDIEPRLSWSFVNGNMVIRHIRFNIGCILYAICTFTGATCLSTCMWNGRHYPCMWFWFWGAWNVVSTMEGSG